MAALEAELARIGAKHFSSGSSQTQRQRNVLVPIPQDNPRTEILSPTSRGMNNRILFVVFLLSVILFVSYLFYSVATLFSTRTDYADADETP